MSTFYRCYLFNSSHHIVDCHEFAAEDDGEAIRAVDRLCDALPASSPGLPDPCQGIELWERARMVFRR